MKNIMIWQKYIYKLLVVDSEADYVKINKLQLIKRKRSLLENELQKLENIETNADGRKVICAVNNLLENKRKAKKGLGELTYEDKELFMSYPIIICCKKDDICAKIMED